MRYTETIPLGFKGSNAGSNGDTARITGTKGDGKVFYSETFGWEKANGPRGWTAPAGYYFLDPGDQGTNWQWWNGPFLDLPAQDPMMQSTTQRKFELAAQADVISDIAGIYFYTMRAGSFIRTRKWW
jgi:hypothetical protein